MEVQNKLKIEKLKRWEEKGGYKEERGINNDGENIDKRMIKDRKKKIEERG